AWERSRKGELCQILHFAAALQPLAKRELLRHQTSSKQAAMTAALGSHEHLVVVLLAQIIAQSTFQSARRHDVLDEPGSVVLPCGTAVNRAIREGGCISNEEAGHVTSLRHTATRDEHYRSVCVPKARRLHPLDFHPQRESRCAQAGDGVRFACEL